MTPEKYNTLELEELLCYVHLQRHTPRNVESATIRHAIWQSLMAYPQTAQPVQKKNEDKLSAGDTELLDEYLHSFMQPGA